MEVLADDQILLLGEALEDDGQESEENYDSLDESDSENDLRLTVQDEFPVPQEIQRKTLAEKQQADPILSKIRQWVKSQHNPLLRSINCFLLMKSFMLTALSISS